MPAFITQELSVKIYGTVKIKRNGGLKWFTWLPATAKRFTLNCGTVTHLSRNVDYFLLIGLIRTNLRQLYDMGRISMLK